MRRTAFLMPAYNPRPEVLLRSLESMLAQTEPVIAANQLRVAQARANAESGMERALWALSEGALMMELARLGMACGLRSPPEMLANKDIDWAARDAGSSEALVVRLRTGLKPPPPPVAD